MQAVSSQSREVPDDHGLELSAPCIFEELIECRPARPGAGNSNVLIGLDRVPATCGHKRADLAALGLRVLVRGGDAEVERDLHDPGISRMTQASAGARVPQRPGALSG